MLRRAPNQTIAVAWDRTIADTKTVLPPGRFGACGITKKKEKFLRRGDGGFCSCLRGVDDDSFLAALRSRGVNGIQVDAFRCELFEVLRQSAGLVGQIVLLC